MKEEEKRKDDFVVSNGEVLRGDGLEKRDEELELLYKKSYYKNINSIRKNIQFFFWLTIIPTVCYIIFLLFLSTSLIRS